MLYRKSMVCHISYAEKEVMNFPKMSSGSWGPYTNQYASLNHFVLTALLRLTFHSLSSPAGSCFLSVRLVGSMRYIVCCYIVEAQWMLIDHRNWKSGDVPFTTDKWLQSEVRSFPVCFQGEMPICAVYSSPEIFISYYMTPVSKTLRSRILDLISLFSKKKNWWY